MAPVDSRAQRLLPRVGVAAALEQVEALREALEDLSRRERLGARGGELNGERQLVESDAELGDLLARLEAGALTEQRHGLGRGERRHRVLDFALDAQELAARHEHVQIGTGAEQRRQLGRRLDHLLQVVEQQEQLAFADVLGEAVLGSQRLGNRLADQRRVAQRGEADPEDTGLVLGNERRRSLDRQPRLPRAAGARQRDQARAFSIAATPPAARVAADERARRTREVRVRDRLQRREALAPSWKIETASAMSLRRCSPRSVSSSLDEFAVTARGPLDRHDLTPHTGREVDVVSHVTLLGERGAPVCRPMRTWIGPAAKAPVIASAAASAPAPWGMRRRMRHPACPPRRRRGQQAARTSPMLGERLGVGLGPELVQQLRRPLDVREEEGDGAGRKVAPHRRQISSLPMRNPVANAAATKSTSARNAKRMTPATSERPLRRRRGRAGRGAGPERTRSPRRRVEVGEEVERAGHEHARAKLVGPPQRGDGIRDRHDVRNVSARPVGELRRRERTRIRGLCCNERAAGPSQPLEHSVDVFVAEHRQPR